MYVELAGGKRKEGELRSQSVQQDGCLQSIRSIKGGRRKIVANKLQANLKTCSVILDRRPGSSLEEIWVGPENITRKECFV